MSCCSCREDCVALRNHFCFNDWALVEDNKRRGVFVESRGHFRLPNCEKLPSFSNETKVCTKTSVTEMRWDLTTSKNGQRILKIYLRTT